MTAHFSSRLDRAVITAFYVRNPNFKDSSHTCTGARLAIDFERTFGKALTMLAKSRLTTYWVGLLFKRKDQSCGSG